jgi:hypothetical protein
MAKKKNKKRNRLSGIRLENLTKRQLDDLKRISKRWHKKMEPRKKAIRESTRITAADLAVTINAKPR